MIYGYLRLAVLFVFMLLGSRMELNEGEVVNIEFIIFAVIVLIVGFLIKWNFGYNDKMTKEDYNKILEGVYERAEAQKQKDEDGKSK